MFQKSPSPLQPQILVEVSSMELEGWLLLCFHMQQPITLTKSWVVIIASWEETCRDDAWRPFEATIPLIHVKKGIKHLNFNKLFLINSLHYPSSCYPKININYNTTHQVQCKEEDPFIFKKTIELCHYCLKNKKKSQQFVELYSRFVEGLQKRG